MPATTAKGLPYPQAADPNDIPADLQRLAEAVDAIPGVASMTTATRDALAAAQKWAGRIIWNTTTSQHERWSGTAWGALASSTTTLTIVETATGVWSADAPARAAGVNPIRFIGVDDPADPTNGINTPANIGQFDTWTKVSA